MEQSKDIQLDPSWLANLQDEFAKPHMQNLKLFLAEQYKHGKKIYPAKKDYFNAFNSTGFEKVKAVILGQDPYHGPGQAHGLSFSVLPGVSQPPSLVNIFKELHSDLGIQPPKHGCLDTWAKQGVLLLNSVLTVEDSKPGSHQGKGWELFTDEVIRQLNEKRENLVFILWGAYAQKKAAFVDRKKHLVIESPHPSPLSSYRGFFGSRPFSKVNAYLEAHKTPHIQWQIPELEQSGNPSIS